MDIVMDLSALKTQIMTKALEPVYIFTGPEVGVMDIYIKQIAKVHNASVVMLDGIEDLAKKMHKGSIVKNAQIYILRDSKEFIQDNDLALKITQKNALAGVPLILVYTNIDKRSKVYKTFQDKIVEFNYLKPDILLKYIQKEVYLTNESYNRLIEVCESDYSRILLEIDKIKRYAQAKQVKEETAFCTLMREGAIFQPPKDAVFDFVDAVLKGKKELAFKLLKSSYDFGEATMVLLSNLYNSTKQLLQVQSFKGDGKITEATGLTPFQVKLASERKGRNSTGDLIYLMRLVRDTEKGIKTGAIEEPMAMPYILANYWG
jgi:DNA polymerase III delta subunit